MYGNMKNGKMQVQKITQFDRVSKKHLVKSVKNTKKKLIIVSMNTITPKMIPVRTEMLENTLW